MDLKVGDKVRLTGKTWGAYALQPLKGEEVEIESTGDTAVFRYKGRTFHIYKDSYADYSAELVQRAPELTSDKALNDALDHLGDSGVTLEDIEAAEKRRRDLKDKKLGRWRSAERPEYTVEAVSSGTERVLKVRQEGVAGVTQVYEAAIAKPVRMSVEMWEVVKEYRHRNDAKLPTEPGVYAPARNVGNLGNTYVYQLDRDGEWFVIDGGIDERSPREHALECMTAPELGGLVKLVAE